MAARVVKPRSTMNPESRAGALRNLPAVADCLSAIEAEAWSGGFNPSYLTNTIREVMTDLRPAIARNETTLPALRGAAVMEVVALVRDRIARDQSALKPVVNATGVILHTNLGRALLAEDAIAAMAAAARSPVNLEFEMESGARGDRDDLVSGELCALTGAEAATVVNNNAAAVMLVLNTLALGGEVIVSRGELVEIGGSFRIPEIMASSGARLREVGATNRTHREDYARAIGADTAFLMKVHPSNYRIVGFSGAVGLAELIELGRAHQLPVVEDLGAGALLDLSAYGLPREPIVRERLAAGAALVMFSGDKLIGGPQCGIVVGRRELIARLKQNPLWRALRIDKLRLAGLLATLRIYRRERAAEQIPTLRLLLRTPAELEVLAQAAKAVLAGRLGEAFQIDVIGAAAQIGSGALPLEELESRALRITHPQLKADAMAAKFRRAGIVGRIHDGAFLLDLRAVESADAFARSYA